MVNDDEKLPESLGDYIDDIFADIDAELAKNPVEDVSLVETVILLKTYYETTEQLKEMGEALFPKTQLGRDLHSKRYAVQLELRKRGKI